ncbi:hypothetical protein [Vibrio splendidus]|uniref:Uncharacterized protein n=1 Tax=Vibrio splendidus TaxID=29497 RepID=A0A2N7JJC7_VIBSP|nr:hypothetical protein [Vibrio splendidus]PMM40565.1 hypothetical protein BCT54_12220 [Vibrio splendidus]
MSLSEPQKHRIRNIAVSLLGVLIITSGFSAATYYFNQKALNERLVEFEHAQDAKLLAYQSTQAQQWDELRGSEQAKQAQFQALHDEIAALEQSLTAQSEQSEQSEQLTLKATDEDIQRLRQQSSSIEQRVLSLAGKVAQLSKRKPLASAPQVNQSSKAVSSETKHSTQKSQTQTKVKTKTSPQLTAPFTLFDIQKRGVHQVAVLGDANAMTMTDLSSVREGQHYQHWTIKRIEPQGVWISKRNTTLFLEK